MAIVVPEETTLVELAKEKNLISSDENKNFQLDMKTLCSNKELKKIILSELNQLGKKSDLKGFEQVILNFFWFSIAYLTIINEISMFLFIGT